MKKICIISSIILNFLFLISIFHFYNRNIYLEDKVDNYYSNYLPKEMYDRVRDKVLDYEWILKNIVKVENVDVMRIYWCGR